MFKRVSVILALVLALTAIVPTISFAEEMTDVGTPRAETLICEPDADVYACPGQFNPYMTGTQASWGMHQIMWDDGLWDVNTMEGKTISTIAADLPTANADYTEWTVKIRDNLKWTDGEPLTAKDVVYTLGINMSIEKMNNYAYYNSLFSKVELVDDYTLKIYCKKPFTRLTTTLGVSIWGCGFRVVPEHIYSKQTDVMSFTDSQPVTSGPYKLKDYDKLGTWILYERRDDWANTAAGILYGEPGPKYILYRVFGNAESRVMAAINNQVDVMNEVSYENLKVMLDANDKIQAWYKQYPFANTDDACGKGLFFNCAVAPYDNVNVRWALTLCCNWVQVSENIFDGIGRMSALQVPAITTMMNEYYKPLSSWLTNDFKIAGDYNPWDPNFAKTLATAIQTDLGYDLSGYTDEQLVDMFGVGYWKTDVDKATELLKSVEGFELKDGKWYYKGEPWKIEVLVHPEDSSTQASRSGKAIADQWSKFGVDVAVTTLAGADLSTRVNLGDFQAADTWDDCCTYSQDFYNNISGWDSTVYNYKIGETATGISSYRLYLSNPELNDKINKVVQEVATKDPASAETKELLTDFLKLSTEAHISITVQAGTKIVPVNTTYWSNFPSAETPYEGPWWWWSCMKFITCRLKPATAQ